VIPRPTTLVLTPTHRSQQHQSPWANLLLRQESAAKPSRSCPDVSNDPTLLNPQFATFSIPCDCARYLLGSSTRPPSSLSRCPGRRRRGSSFCLSALLTGIHEDRIVTGGTYEGAELLRRYSRDAPVQTRRSVFNWMGPKLARAYPPSRAAVPRPNTVRLL
jgi:hypothetical protein